MHIHYVYPNRHIFSYLYFFFSHLQKGIGHPFHASEFKEPHGFNSIHCLDMYVDTHGNELLNFKIKI